MLSNLKRQFAKAKIFLSKEEPKIVRFQGKKYGIRKKNRFREEYQYLDLIDIQDSKETNWRSTITCDRIYSWCSSNCIVYTKEAFEKYQDLVQNRISSTPVPKEELNRLLFTAKLKGGE